MPYLMSGYLPSVIFFRVGVALSLAFTSIGMRDLMYHFLSTHASRSLFFFLKGSYSMYCISLYTLNGEVTEDIISQAYENLLDENTTLDICESYTIQVLIPSNSTGLDSPVVKCIYQRK